MKKFKRITAFLLAIMMLLSCLSVVSLAAPNLTQVKSVAAYGIDDDDINLKWAAVKGAQGYQVWQYNGTTKRYFKVSSTSGTYLEVDDLRSATSYKFKVRAYAKYAGKYYYSPFSAVITTATEPDEVDGLRVSARSKTSLTLKWEKVPRATKYQVYLYDSAKARYVKKATVSSNTAKLSGLESGVSYKIKVRAYLYSGKKYYYGDYSDVLSAKTSGVSSGTTTVKEYIGNAKAISIALNHAKLSKSQVRELECHLDKENGTYIYEVEFERGYYDYEYEINAYTGKILSVEKG